MSKTKYVARLNGTIVGQRTTASRVYTNALIVQRIEEVARKAAYERAITETDKSNYRYYCSIAEGTSKFTHSLDEVIKASGWIDGGFGAYAERLREQAIARFEDAKREGLFNPFVATWCGRPDLAQKAVAQYTSASVRFIAIVPAEVA